MLEIILEGDRLSWDLHQSSWDQWCHVDKGEPIVVGNSTARVVFSRSKNDDTLGEDSASAFLVGPADEDTTTAGTLSVFHGFPLLRFPALNQWNTSLKRLIWNTSVTSRILGTTKQWLFRLLRQLFFSRTRPFLSKQKVGNTKFTIVKSFVRSAILHDLVEKPDGASAFFYEMWAAGISLDKHEDLFSRKPGGGLFGN